tara:strand:- start:2106 stop:2435 length:330 start_codon:yes stop_codon:yes gene_type:complete
MDSITFRKTHDLKFSVEKTGKKSNSCQDYVIEKKLQRLVRNSLNDNKTIEDLIGVDGFGRSKKSVIENIKIVIKDKILALNGEEIRHYIKKLQKVPVSTCIKQIRKKYS